MKGYRDNGGGGGGFGARNKTVYDDVFGGPPKFGATTLPPRLEDYTEIFQGFHASRGSSIPVLDLPPPSDDSDDVWFDVQSSIIDYSEVFGGFNGLDFAVSYEELFKSSKVVDDDSSDDVWTPAQSESLSDESDPCAVLETNPHPADPNQLFGLNLPNEPILKAENDVSNGMANDSQFLDVPGSTVLENQAHPSKIENEKLFSMANNDHCAGKGFGVVSEGKQLKKSFSQPLDSVCGKERYGSDLNHLVGNQKAYPVGNKPVLSVSDLSLKTQPSHLPPPSRPPPALISKKVDTGSFNSKLKTSKSYAFERMTGNRSPPYFDVEIDASSSAAADAAAMKDAVEQAQAKLKCAKELMDRKKEGRQSRSKLRMENNEGDKKVRVNEDHVRSGTFGVERMKGLLQRDSTITRHRHGENKTPCEADENELYENLIEIQLKDNDVETAGNLVGFNEREVTENQFEIDNERIEDDMASTSFEWEDYDVGLLEALKKGDKEGLKKTEEQDQKETHPEMTLIHIKDDDCEREIGERIIQDSFWLEEKEKMSVKESEQEENDDDTSEALSEQDENKKEQTLYLNEEILQERLMQEEDKKNEKIESVHEMDCVFGVNSKLQDQEREESKEREESVSEFDGVENQQEGTKWDDDDRRLNSTEGTESSTTESSEALDVVYQVDDNQILQAAGDDHHDIPNEKNAATPKTPFSVENEKIEGTVEQTHQKVTEELFSLSGLNQNDLQGVKVEVRTTDVTNSNLLNESAGETYGVDVIGQTPIENDKTTSQLKNATGRINTTMTTSTLSRVAKEWVEAGTRPLVDQADSFRNTNNTASNIICQTVGRKDELHNKGVSEKENGEKLQRARELENERRRKIEEEKLQRDRELEKEHLKKKEEKLQREKELENERIRKIEEEKLQREKELQYERARKIEEKLQRERELENERLRKIEEEKLRRERELENERLKKIEEEKLQRERELENERLRKIEEEKLQRERELEYERLKKIEEETLQRERELEYERLRKIEEEKLQRERELENERLRKIEEERERQIEREKDRMAVDRATIEARERAFAETRERSERAAVERATAEFRQRALAEARERLEKACAEARERSLAEKAMEGRLRVEKATAEARERAERSVDDKFSASRSSGMRQSSLSSDQSDSQYQKVGSYSGLRYSQNTAYSGGEGESPQRCKARFERHQRTADRAAKALAEKNMRDLLAQKELAERNRLAEGLDAEVKRWSSGKQGNLRALLSTLQYILGPDSGWQPVPLTEVITTAAVKKAYRKATLCVHPDKLQQRGASIQQKYICEKVFDLLKEAWNKFNSEER